MLSTEGIQSLNINREYLQRMKPILARCGWLLSLLAALTGGAAQLNVWSFDIKWFRESLKPRRKLGGQIPSHPLALGITSGSPDPTHS
jgi:hypothetical protein